ncbi:hypothetical protein [Sedimentisphaera salicampi]|uniref:hypothetical protein n=1 Tax=Sedimentisphaera salicampi TaxID=1941349 RepID=UPI000B9C35AD|nr:hypothetical protein [Sedimentisphaera salicampi]OXU15460.1 hypothetical protein SMSP1_00941 [Sedimentisphaera salicampi]
MHKKLKKHLIGILVVLVICCVFLFSLGVYYEKKLPGITENLFAYGGNILKAQLSTERKLTDKEKKRIFRQTRFPAKRIETEWFAAKTPAGWELRDCRDWDGFVQQKLIFLTSYKVNEVHGFQIPPVIIFAGTKSGSFESSMLINGLQDFIYSSAQAKEDEIQIDGKTCYYKRYEGEMSWQPDVPDNILISPNCHSVTINFDFDYKGLRFYGFFWGFPEQEKDFWDMLKTVEWKK